MPDFLTDLSWEQIPLGPFDSRLWWLLIALVIALIFTLQAIETAVEGFWPHQRRPTRYRQRARKVQRSWGIVAILLLPGALLLIGIVSVLIWQDPESPGHLAIGASLLGIGWVLFLAFSLNWFNLGRIIGNVGLIGPIALMVLLLVADLVLLDVFLGIVPPWEEVTGAVEEWVQDTVPFLGDEEG